MNEIDNILCVYVDVGQLPLERANEFVEQLKEAHKSLLDRLPPYVGVMYLPVRPNNSTRIEVIKVS